MKAFITSLSVLICSLCFGQITYTTDPPSTERGTFVLLNKPAESYKVQEVDSTEYDYFAAYLVIQTSEVTPEQLDYTKKLLKYVKQNHGILYITIQSGTPPCIPSPGHPCPKK